MVKTLEEDSRYEPSVRSNRWLKLKRDYLDKAASDTLDLVVIGAKWGEGKRTGFYGTILLASFNPDIPRFETTGMVGTGFTDEDLAKFKELLEPLEQKAPSELVYQKDQTGNKKVVTNL